MLPMILILLGLHYHGETLGCFTFAMQPVCSSEGPVPSNSSLQCQPPDFAQQSDNVINSSGSESIQKFSKKNGRQSCNFLDLLEHYFITKNHFDGFSGGVI